MSSSTEPLGGEMRQHNSPVGGARPSVQRQATGSAPGKRSLVETAHDAVQLRAAPGGDGGDHESSVHAEAARGVSGGGGPLPHGDTIQRLFGPQHDISGVKAHVGGEAAGACDAIGASAYATGNNVAFRGSGAADLHTAAHEATHVVQQRGGVQLLGGVGVAGDPHEQQADHVADAVVRGEPVGHMLGGGSGGAAGGGAVQRQQTPNQGGQTGGQVGAQTGQQLGTQTPATPGGEQAGGTTTTAPQPVGLCTEFGDFTIYPDSFIGPLPVSDRAASSWPIRRAAFDNLMTRLRAVKNGTSKLVVTGTPQFTTKVYLDLGWLMTSGVGQELINDIASTSFTVTINEASGGNVTGYNPDAASWENTDGTPGAGANATIGYNPVEINPYGGTDPWMTRPPAIGLAHEMVHAWTAVHGTRARGNDAAGVRRRELQATGLGEFANLQISENRFRAAFGLPLRPRY